MIAKKKPITKVTDKFKKKIIMMGCKIKGLLIL